MAARLTQSHPRAPWLHAAGEIVMFDGLISVYRNMIDVFFYIVGSAKENELILAHVLSTFVEALGLLFRYVWARRARAREAARARRLNALVTS